MFQKLNSSFNSASHILITFDNFWTKYAAGCRNCYTSNVSYETLVLVTDNFTNRRMRGNCSKVTALEMNEVVTVPAEIVSYFPSLPKTSIHNDDLSLWKIQKLSELIYVNMHKLLHIFKMLFFWKSR